VSQPLEMLRSVKDFRAFGEGSRSRAHPLLILRWRPNGLGRTRFGLSTGKRLGGAVVRNLVRRRLRAAIRRSTNRPDGGWDILLVARPESATASYRELTSALERLLDRMAKGQGNGAR
jgi:ribonuclease P protein component